MPGYSYKISLRLWHPTRDLTAAGRILGHAPSRSWRAGTARTTPEGEPLSGTYDASYWTSTLARGEYVIQTLGEALAALVRDLEPHKPLLDDLVLNGGRAEFFIGWFVADGNSGDLLDWRLLEGLARLRIGLSFDVYPFDPPPG